MIKRICTFFIVASVIISACMLPSNVLAEDVSYRFGVKNPARAEIDPEAMSAPLFNKQGVNNYYAYYSKNNNKGGIITPSELIECEYAVNGNSYAARTMAPKKSDVDNYLNNIWPQLYPGERSQFWWKIDKLGMVCPAGNMVAVVAFKAPETGEYVINAEFYGGAKDDQGFVADEADGVSCAVIAPSGTLFQKNTGRECTAADTAINIGEKTVSLKSGEFVYFTVDPNETFENDLGHWYVKITQKASNESNAGTTSNNSSSSKPSGGNTSQTSSTGSTTSTTSENSSESSLDNSDVSQTEEPSSDVDSSTENDSSDAAAVGSEDTSEEAEEKDQGISIWLIVIAVIVVLGAAGAAVWFFVIKKNKGSQS